MKATGPAKLAAMAMGLAVVATAPAVGQEALGGGDALDANLSTRGRRNLPAAPIDFASRNLLITNSAAGGRGFRGTVGYTAPDDFRGLTGSNDLFRFRRGAAFSSLDFVNAQSTQQRLRYGEALGMIIEYRRETSGATPRNVGTAFHQERRFFDAQLQIDRMGTSISDFAVQPQTIGFGYDTEGQPSLIQASSLRGIHLVPSQQQVQQMGLSTFDQLRVREDAEAGRPPPEVGAPFRTSFEELRVRDRRIDPAAPSTRVEPHVTDDRIDMTFEPDYRALLERVAERYARSGREIEPSVGPELLRRLDEQYNQLRRRLGGTEPPPPGTPSPPRADSVEPEPEAGTPRFPTLREFGVILRHDRRVEHLAGGDEGRFNELLASAEQHLRAGEYFLAERHFGRALRFTPEHPLATAGMAHAQIGAGLYASAALSLRSLLGEHPEMIDVKYEPGLLPNRVRLVQGVGTL
ncbi:MAG: hypothetical protein ACYSTY_08735, partial [Planctomycetota bacterium]